MKLLNIFSLKQKITGSEGKNQLLIHLIESTLIFIANFKTHHHLRLLHQPQVVWLLYLKFCHLHLR